MIKRPTAQKATEAGFLNAVSLFFTPDSKPIPKSSQSPQKKVELKRLDSLPGAHNTKPGLLDLRKKERGFKKKERKHSVSLKGQGECWKRGVERGERRGREFTFSSILLSLFTQLVNILRGEKNPETQ